VHTVPSIVSGLERPFDHQERTRSSACARCQQHCRGLHQATGTIGTQATKWKNAGAMVSAGWVPAHT